MSKEFKILVIKMSSMGDIIHSWPFAVALRKNWPQAHITWAVNEEYQDLIPRDYVDELLIIDRKRLFKFSYWRELRNKFKDIEYDWIIDLQAILKSNIISLLANGKKRYSYCDAKEGSWLVSKPLRGKYCQDNVVERYLDVIRCLGGKIEVIEFPKINFQKGTKDLNNKFNLPEQYVVFAPATRNIKKNWLPESFAKLGRMIFDKYHMPIVLIGTKNDEKIGNTIVNFYPSLNWINLIGKTNLAELAFVINGAEIFIGGDSGPMHMANAFQKKLISIYMATNPKRLGPYGNSNAVVLTSDNLLINEQEYDNNFVLVSGITVYDVFKVYENMKASMKDD